MTACQKTHEADSIDDVLHHFKQGKCCKIKGNSIFDEFVLKLDLEKIKNIYGHKLISTHKNMSIESKSIIANTDLVNIHDLIQNLEEFDESLVNNCDLYKMRHLYGVVNFRRLTKKKFF